MPRGPGIPARGEVWRSRPPITSEMRAAFQATVADEETQERAAYGLGPDEVAEPDVETEIKRTAIRRAFVARGYLMRRNRTWILRNSRKPRGIVQCYNRCGA